MPLWGVSGKPQGLVSKPVETIAAGTAALQVERYILSNDINTFIIFYASSNIMINAGRHLPVLA
jgi:hypothetical protein